MTSCKLIIKDEVNIQFEGLTGDMRRRLANLFKYEIPYAKYHPAYKLGRWDGTISLFSIGGTGYLYQLPTILQELDKAGVEVADIADHRRHFTLTFPKVTETYWADKGKVWPKGHPEEGKPIMLRDYQVETITRFIENPQSLQEVATGAGKTITTATLAHICENHGRTIVIVPNKSLVEQTEEDFVNVGLDVGVYYGNRKDVGKTHTICTWQSLNVLDKKSKDRSLVEEQLSLAEFLDGVTTVIVDEAHQSKADVLRSLLTQNLRNAPIRWGLTGTVPKEKYEAESIFASIGPVVGGIAAHELQEMGVLSNCHVNVCQLIDLKEFRSYADELKYLTTDPDRLEYIGKFIGTISQSGNTLVLVNRIESGKALQQTLAAVTGQDVAFISGAVDSKERKEEYDDVKTATNKVIVATYGVAAVGINIPRIFNLVLLEPGKSFVRVIQSIGRGIRKAKDKDYVDIWDITSSCKYAKRHLTERKKHYKDAKYKFTVTKIDWTAE